MRCDFQFLERHWISDDRKPKRCVALVGYKGRTIRKVMGGGWGKSQKKIHTRENAKKKNSCKEEGKEKKFMQKEGPIVIFI